MKKRPTSITVIAWILIVISTLSSIPMIVMMNNPTTHELMSKNPLPIPLQYAISYFGLLLTITTNIAMLKGRNWGRLTYVGWMTISLIIGLLTSPIKPAMIPSFVIFLIIAFFLFSPKANEFFSNRESEPNHA